MLPKRVFVVIGGGEYQVPLIKKAKKRDFEVWVVDIDPNCPGRELADFFINKSTTDEDSVLMDIKRFLKSEKKIAGVATLGTDVPRTVAKVAKFFNLPSVSYEAAVATTDKVLIRKILNNAGLPHIKFITISKADDLKEALSEARSRFREDIVVKPVDRSGARGVKLIKHEEPPDTALEKIKKALKQSFKGQVIVEEYLPGPEFSMDAIVYRGKIWIMDIADRNIVLHGDSFIEVGHTVPTNRLNREFILRAEAILKKAISSLGIDNTGVNADIKYSLKHRDFVILEIASRLSGDKNASHTIPIAHSLDPVEYLLDVATGKDPSAKIEKQLTSGGERKHIRWALHRALILIHAEGKTVEHINLNPAEMEKICDDWGIWVKPGEKIKSTEDNPSRHGYVIVSDKDYRKALQKAIEALNTLGKSIILRNPMREFPRR